VRAAALRLHAALEALPADTIALILVLGCVLGTFPVFGCPTLLCLAAAMAFRINLPALQVVNQLSSPLQLVLILPLARMGSLIVGAPTGWSVRAMALQAIAGWLCVCVPLGLALYLPLAYALRRRCFN